MDTTVTDIKANAGDRKIRPLDVLGVDLSLISITADHTGRAVVRDYEIPDLKTLCHHSQLKAIG